jgi:hypothetical protein
VRHPRGPGRDGLDVTLVPGPAAPVPAGFPHRLLPAPWLVADGRAAPDRHTGKPRVHEDHVYVATTAGPRPVRKPEHQVRWFTPDGIASAPSISEDSRILAAELLALAARNPAPGSAGRSKATPRRPGTRLTPPLARVPGAPTTVPRGPRS